MEKYKQKYFQVKPINSLITRLFFSLLFNSIHLIFFGQNAVPALTKYMADNHSIVGYNLPLYNNRPLYCNNTDAFILTGDKPLIRFAQTPYIYGSFKAAILHNGKLKWLDDCSSIKMEYRGNMTTWVINDTTSHFPVIKLSVVPMADVVGLSIHAEIEKVESNDKLIWIFGGAQYRNNGSLSWNLDITGFPETGNWDFEPESCKNNQINIHKDKFVIGLLSDSTNKSSTKIEIAGSCSAHSPLKVINAENITPGAIENSNVNAVFPIVSGTIDLGKSERDIYWSVLPFNPQKQDTLSISPFIAWQQGMKRIETLSNRIVVKTPDEKLNVLASVSTSVIDAVWYDPVFVHGAMLWNVPFPGWRTIYGGTMYGWHDRVRKEARYYIDSQIRNSDKLQPKADTSLLLTLQDKSSRYFGAGRINKDQWVYNFQSQFFDQLIAEWRSTGDTELENFLRPALELHLKWQEDCFDPDRDGVYESYVNLWPTDSHWYNGGGTAEETSYAYTGHKAAYEMAIHKGDTLSADFHRKKLRQIRNGFFSKMWISEKGFSGAYREQGGYERLHEDPWLYSIFLPVDAHLLSKEQSISSLFYTQWGLQNDRMAAGGRRVWTSNWVPGVFSIREMYPGDNYHLALAYFLSGMGDDGWDIMKGTFYEGAFNGKVPGDLGTPQGGTDFNDCSSMFTRVLVEGLFGYQPDYPGNIVKVAPQFPKEWDSASISTPDYSYQFKIDKKVISASIHLTKSAAIDYYLPVNVSGITKVLMDGSPFTWELLPGYGQSLLHLKLSARNNVNITVIPTELVPKSEPVTIEKNAGDSFQLKFPDAAITSVCDSQKILSGVTIRDGILYGKVTGNTGYHTLLANTSVGKAPQTRIIYFKIAQKQDSLKAIRKTLRVIPADADWECLNISHLFNADVRTIYQQKYLSPRPNTVSARIGTDGYSAWTFIFWKQKPPLIKLDSVQYLMKDSNLITTKQHVPFYWNSFSKNIAFTSLWDNWPNEATILVHRKGKAIFLLVCGSTNQMQCHIANANVILTYADQSKDTLALIPPFNYWNLSPINIKAGAAGQASRGDYTNVIDSYAVPRPWPSTVQLGENCRAMLLNRVLKTDVELESITLKTVSQEVVVGLMGVTIMK
jgi:hypothetical protein